MTEFDPLALLNNTHGMSMGGNMPGGEAKHKKEQENLDEMALAVLGKKPTQKTAKILSNEGLINGPKSRRPMNAPNQNINSDHNQEYNIQVSSHHIEKIKNLEAQIEFLQQKLNLCETKLTPEQLESYKLDWIMQIANVVGPDLMVAAGKGFQQLKTEKSIEETKQASSQPESPSEETNEINESEDMTVEDIFETLEDEDYDREATSFAKEVEKELPDYLRG